MPSSPCGTTPAGRCANRRPPPCSPGRGPAPLRQPPGSSYRPANELTFQVNSCGDGDAQRRAGFTAPPMNEFIGGAVSLSRLPNHGPWNRACGRCRRRPAGAAAWSTSRRSSACQIYPHRTPGHQTGRASPILRDYLSAQPLWHEGRANRPFMRIFHNEPRSCSTS